MAREIRYLIPGNNGVTEAKEKISRKSMVKLLYVERGQVR